MENKQVTLTIPVSRYKRFVKKNEFMRFGQEFYNYMDLHKIVSEPNKSFCDKLYVADDAKAHKMIQSILDHNS